MDFAGPFFNRMFLIVVDAWSKWLEVFDVSAATADITARKTEELIARYGIPTEIVTDNGTQFTSSIIQQLCQKWGIRHVTSPPFHPQSNGQAERIAVPLVENTSMPLGIVSILIPTSTLIPRCLLLNKSACYLRLDLLPWHNVRPLKLHSLQFTLAVWDTGSLDYITLHSNIGPFDPALFSIVHHSDAS
nr:unnamed protein product [Spirometra erinaceieuropaei]